MYVQLVNFVAFMFDGKNTKILIILLAGVISITSACKSSEKTTKQIREAEKAEMQAQREAQAEYELAVKRHQDIQSKQTTESAKLLKKQQRKINRSKKRSLWDRIFNNKCDSPVDSGS